MTIDLNHSRLRLGMTIVEVLISIGVIGLLLSVALPAVQHAREKSRAASCRNNLRQLAIAAAGFESFNGHFPPTSTTWIEPGKQRHLPISSFRHLLPYLDPVAGKRVDMDDMSDSGWIDIPPEPMSKVNRELVEVRFTFFQCPSDSNHLGTNYRCNLGTSTKVVHSSLQMKMQHIEGQGAFVNARGVRASEFHDGLSNTAMFSERVIGDQDPESYDPFRDFFSHAKLRQGTDRLLQGCISYASYAPPSEYSYGGNSWLLGGWLHTWYLHRTPPNWTTPDCGLGPGIIDGGEVIVSARSMHPQSVHTAMADGSVRRIQQTIDPTVWHALGTRSNQ